jgi:nucleotide-binding universal stress UspA family protein
MTTDPAAAGPAAANPAAANPAAANPAAADPAAAGPAADPAAARPVVVGVDGSECALDAVRWAAVEADRRAAALRLVTVFTWQPEAGHHGLREQYREELIERARRRVLADALSAAEQTVPGLAVSTELVVGLPLRTLDEESHRAQLLVLGSRGLGGLTGLLIGSVAVGVSAHAGCPVVVVRGEDRAPAATGPVVVGVDGPTNSDTAVGFAVEFAASRGAPLVAVHTWGELVLDAQATALIDWPAMEAYERSLLAERLAPWTEKYPQVPVEQVLVRGAAAPELVDRSRNAQLVVVGSRGRGNLAGLVLGSVSHGLLHRSHCPVAVVRPGTTGV